MSASAVGAMAENLIDRGFDVLLMTDPDGLHAVRAVGVVVLLGLNEKCDRDELPGAWG